MAYIGPAPKLGQNREVDDISSGFNGSTTAFTLQVSGSNVSPGSANSIIVSVNNVIQNPNTDYTINGSTITFTSAPTNGQAFFAVVLNQGVDTSSPADGSVTTVKLGDNSVTAAKLASGAINIVNDTSPQLGGNLDVNTKNITFGDSADGSSDDVLSFGASGDLKIYHDTVHSRIVDTGTGDLSLQTSKLNVGNASNSEAMAVFTENGSVDLYFNNSKKIETISTGIQTVESVKMTHGGNGVNLKQVHEAGVGNTASTTATIPAACVGGGTVTVTCMHNGNTSITTTKMFPIMFQGNTTPNLGSEIFSINANSAASFSVSAANLGVTVTNNAGAHAKIRVTFDITANV